MWALRAVLRGQLSALDSLVLVSLYGLYLLRAAASTADGPEPVVVAAQLSALPARERRRWVLWLMLFAATVILLTAVPFGDAVLANGSLVGISPYLLLQWLVPVATETPELVVAFVLLTHGRGGQSAAVLLAGAVSQYTLALGTLPIAYVAWAGAGPLPLAGCERVELLLSSTRCRSPGRRGRGPATSASSRRRLRARAPGTTADRCRRARRATPHRRARPRCR